MNNTDYRLKRTLIRGSGAALLTAAMTVLPLAAAYAGPISPVFVSSGETSLDTVSSFGPTSGSFDVTVGGSITTTTYVGDTPTGANPLSGDPTHTGDGFGYDGLASAGDEEFLTGLDTNFWLNNGDATDSYDVVLKLAFDNSVNADGSDAYADSEFVVNIGGVDVFWSDLASDTVGDLTDVSHGTVAGSTAAHGDAFSHTGTEFFTVTLAAAEAIEVVAFWTFEGGDYAGGLAEGALSMDLTIHSVAKTDGDVPVPEPGTLLLMAAGLFAVRGRLRQASI